MQRGDLDNDRKGSQGRDPLMGEKFQRGITSAGPRTRLVVPFGRPRSEEVGLSRTATY